LLVAAPEDQQIALSHLSRACLPTVFVTGVQHLEKQFAERKHESANSQTTNRQMPGTSAALPGLGSSLDLNSGHSSTSLSRVASISDETDGSHVTDSAWSRVASRAAQLPFQNMMRRPRIAKSKGKEILVNAEGRRLDHPIAYDAQKVADMEKLKYCNQHYIGKGCCHYNCGNRNCPHRHDAKLSLQEKQVLRLVARETVCKKGTSCRDPDYIYGHQCPYPKSGSGSICVNGHACRFKMMHGMDLVVASRVPPVGTAKEEAV
jgi:hypothetical protein